MNLNEMVALVRKDLHDEDSSQYRWEDATLARHIGQAVKEFSQAVPLEQTANLATTPGSRLVDISGLTGRILIEAAEYPVDQFPPRYRRFALWDNTLTLLGLEVPDGADCRIYYGKLHTLDETGSSLPDPHTDLVAAGACGYAATEMSAYTLNRVNVGGTNTPEDLMKWGEARLLFFRAELKRLGRHNRVRVRELYVPYYPVMSKTTDWGP